MRYSLHTNITAFLLVFLVMGVSYHPTSARAEGFDPSSQFFQDTNLVSLRITIAPKELNQLLKDPRTFIPVDVKEGSNRWTNVGLHLKGGAGSSEPLDRKPSLSLHFERFYKGRAFHGLTRIQLNNCHQDPSYLNEIIATEIFRCSGVPCPRATHAKIELNGRDLGLYVLREGVDRKFLHRCGLDSSGALYQGTYVTDITGGIVLTSGDPIQGEKSLARIRDALLETDPRNRSEGIAKIIDIDEFCRFMAAEVLTCHADGYTMAANNYRLFCPYLASPFPNSNVGKAIFIPSGMDVMFAQPSMGVFPRSCSRIAGELLGTAAGRRNYSTRLREIFEHCFNSENLAIKISTMKLRVEAALFTRDPEETVAFQKAIAKLLHRIQEREKHLKSYFEQPAIDLTRSSSSNQTHNISSNSSSESTLLSIAIPGSAWFKSSSSGGATAFRTNIPAIGSSLVLAANDHQVSASSEWCARVLLTKGKYGFSGQSRVIFDSQFSTAVPSTLFLRCSNTTNVTTIKCLKSPTAANLKLLFEVSDDREAVELSCGAQLFRTGIIIPLESLALVKF